MRQRLDEIQAQVESEKQWWEKRRGDIQSDFMKELDGSDTHLAKSAADEEAVLVEAPAKKGKKGKKQSHAR